MTHKIPEAPPCSSELSVREVWWNALHHCPRSSSAAGILIVILPRSSVHVHGQAGSRIRANCFKQKPRLSLESVQIDYAVCVYEPTQNNTTGPWRRVRKKQVARYYFHNTGFRNESECGATSSCGLPEILYFTVRSNRAFSTKTMNNGALYLFIHKYIYLILLEKINNGAQGNVYAVCVLVNRML
jgi:hypothetical protein